MKKLICLLLQVVSLTMWLVYIVDKKKIAEMLNVQSEIYVNSVEVMYIVIATTILIMAMIGFLVSDKTHNKKEKITVS